ncbi:MAG: response regulator, partial [Deltaproteobacteria bacterium]|nr:response regulator [Deltaproteobacteria bacterium]
VFASALRMLGYKVLPASNAADAIEVARAYAAPIDLLVTDVVMPGLSGPKLAERLVAERPGLATLFVSGYSREAATHRGVLDPNAPLLEKPFTHTQLARKIRELLASRAPK